MGIPAMYLVNLAASATYAGISVPLLWDNVKDFTLHWKCSGTVNATWKVEASDDPRANMLHPDYANAYWSDQTTLFALTDPAGGAAEESIAYSNGAWHYIRVSTTHNSGAGYLWMTFAGVSSA